MPSRVRPILDEGLYPQGVLPRGLQPCVQRAGDSRSPSKPLPGHRQLGPHWPVGLQAVGTVELSGAAEVTIFLSAARMRTGGLGIDVAVAVAVTAAVAAAAAAGIGGCAIVQACWRCSSVSTTGTKVQRSSRVNTGSN